MNKQFFLSGLMFMRCFVCLECSMPPKSSTSSIQRFQNRLCHNQRFEDAGSLSRIQDDLKRLDQQVCSLKESVIRQNQALCDKNKKLTLDVMQAKIINGLQSLRPQISSLEGCIVELQKETQALSHRDQTLSDQLHSLEEMIQMQRRHNTGKARSQTKTPKEQGSAVLDKEDVHRKLAFSLQTQVAPIRMPSMAGSSTNGFFGEVLKQLQALQTGVELVNAWNLPPNAREKVEALKKKLVEIENVCKSVEPLSPVAQKESLTTPKKANSTSVNPIGIHDQPGSTTSRDQTSFQVLRSPRQAGSSGSLPIKTAQVQRFNTCGNYPLGSPVVKEITLESLRNTTRSTEVGVIKACGIVQESREVPKYFPTTIPAQGSSCLFSSTLPRSPGGLSSVSLGSPTAIHQPLRQPVYDYSPQAREASVSYPSVVVPASAAGSFTFTVGTARYAGTVISHEYQPPILPRAASATVLGSTPSAGVRSHVAGNSAYSPNSGYTALNSGRILSPPPGLSVFISGTT